MKLTLLLLLPIVSGLAAAPSAQRTWIVDNLNRPGAHFTDLPPAVLAASHGDTIVMRGGGPNYTAPLLDKGVTLTPELWSFTFGLAGVLTIQGIPAGERCAIKVLSAYSDVVCQDNQGAIHMEHVSVGSRYSGHTITIRRCDQVTLTYCTASYLVAEQSTVLFSDGGIHAPPGPKPWAASLTDSRLILANSASIHGSPGSVDPFLCLVTQSPGPGVQMQNSDILLAMYGSILGGSVGTTFCGLLAVAPAAFGSGTITHNPAFPFSYSNPVEGDIELIPRAVPDQGARVDWPGGTLTASVSGPPNVPVAIFASLPLPTPIFGGPLSPGLQGWPGAWIDFSQHVLVGVGNTGFFIFTVNVPIPPTAPMVPLAFQSALLVDGKVVLSTGSVAITAPQGTL